MPLKGKSRSAICGVVLVSGFFLGSCTGGDDAPTGSGQLSMDSLGKIQQRRKADSLKRTNPLLIVPPDSIYTGSYVDKYADGITKFRGFFRFGKRHGQWMSFYPSGEAWSEMHYDKGKRHGPNVTYFENGKVRYTGVYKNDLRDSIWLYYDSAGNLAERVLFKDDRIVRKLGAPESK